MTSDDAAVLDAGWFTEARFGMFIHFGAYAVLGRDAWVRSREQLTIEQYQAAVDAFQPENFDPEAWADAAAAAGVRYAVMTAKHHDGFCLFDTGTTTYSTLHNGYGRDLVAEFLAAFRARGIKVGLYYSLLDWHHPDYPSVHDENHPHRGDAVNGNPDAVLSRYVAYMHEQVRELVTRYGVLDTLFFDFSYQDLVGQAWGGEELVAMVRSHQPQILINNRLDAGAGGYGTILDEEPAPWAGDYASPESLLPAGPVHNAGGIAVPWEAALPHNNHWGWFEGDTSFKSAHLVIRTLVQAVSKGGNVLLNVGPQPDGAFPAEAIEIFAQVGDWLERNGDSIYGAAPATLPKPEWGYYTQRGDVVFAHVLEAPIGPLALSGIPAQRVRRMWDVSTGAERPRLLTWVTAPYPDTVFVAFGPEHTYTYPLPDDVDTVIAIELTPA
ncbi:alpha-L-fucosidase [Microbacterium sp. H1-D42]|uniref:alpha-L-fucosidase n=1 Tax=Microbacterium sp. H1-D42 TaxID=2925844 RepID=UPI001F52C182|nr:alpha-L-fucosidase [Microbacterium sp. H1-D42]UNK72247.1 alpha-L-fucosidase [Microbacterium sp. H1-D42]